MVKSSRVKTSLTFSKKYEGSFVAAYQFKEPVGLPPLYDESRQSPVMERSIVKGSDSPGALTDGSTGAVDGASSALPGPSSLNEGRSGSRSAAV